MKYVRMHIFMRCASKQCINNFQIHSWPIIAVLMTFEATESINFISKSTCFKNQ